MSAELDSIIQIGNDLASIKYYMVATCTILLYDHLLTLSDEVKYFWSARKPWTFWLFVINRYFPVAYQIWQYITNFGPQSQLSDRICDRTAWAPLFTFTVCTLLAQVVLTVRIYAVTMKNIRIVAGFATITVCGLAIGLCLTILAAKDGPQALPQIPIDVFHFCVFVQHRHIEFGATGLALLYDLLAFSLIISLAVMLREQGLKVSGILEVIARDATLYFLVIFSAHFVLEMTLIFGRDTVQLLPAPGVIVYLPVMISRIMISLKKASDPRKGEWSLAEPTENDTNLQSLKFFRPARVRPNWRQDDILLETLPESRLAAQ